MPGLQLHRVNTKGPLLFRGSGPNCGATLSNSYLDANSVEKCFQNQFAMVLAAQFPQNMHTFDGIYLAGRLEQSTTFVALVYEERFRCKWVDLWCTWRFLF